MGKKRTRQDKVNDRQEQQRQPFQARTESQKQMIRSIFDNTITLAHGIAGSGKTLTALYVALCLMKSHEVSEIFYLRSNPKTDNYKDIGSYPGERNEKFAPLLIPVESNLKKLVPVNHVEYYMKKITPLFVEEVRGADFNDCVVIADEVQNCSPDTVKTILTRINTDSKAILLGDTGQRDSNRFDDGLLDAIWRLKGINGIGCIEFGEEDCLRNPLIRDILKAYISFPPS